MRSFWERLFGKGTAAPPPPVLRPPANDVDDLLEDIEGQIRRDVAAGFHEPDEILRSAMEVFEGELPDAELAGHARHCLDRALAAHSAEQASWAGPTDCDRLDSAFAALERGGIVARQNFSCCGTCGSAEIWDEVKAFEASGRRAYGYAFYHMQDTESAVEGFGLHLAYGGCEEGEEPAIATGRAIVDELARHGLETDWDGTWGKRIGVSLDWKRRRAG